MSKDNLEESKDENVDIDKNTGGSILWKHQHKYL